MRNLVLIGLIGLTGCATLTSGPLKRVTVNTNPPGAMIRMSDGTVKSSPAILNFSGFKNQTIMIEKEGYEPYSAILTKRFLARFWWNVLFWPGAVVDLASGSAWRIEPKSLDVTLSKK